MGLTDAMGVLKLRLILNAPTQIWKCYDDTKSANVYTSAQSLNQKGLASPNPDFDPKILTPKLRRLARESNCLRAKLRRHKPGTNRLRVKFE